MNQKSSLIEQIRNGENKTLELKEALPNNASIAKTVVAFSNTGGGKIIVGVDDKRDIVGINEKDIFKLQDKISSLIFDTIYPHVLPEIYTINQEGKLLIIIEIQKGNLPPYFLKSKGKNSGTYMRVGATNRMADFEDILELERQKRSRSFDEEICYDIDLKKLDLSPLTEKFKQHNKTLNQHKLKNLKLIKEENSKLYPTNGLVILLGEFEHCKIQCARFKGKTMEVFIDKKEYKGDIFSLLENSQNFILNHINLKGDIKGLYRKDRYEIPKIALREALVNAFVHRDYTNKGRDIKLGIYDDIVNIVSPGAFPSGITQDDIQNGRSEIRNRVVANVFKELNLIEQWGSGIIRMKILCEEEGLKIPNIKEKNDFVDAELFRSQTESNRLRPIATDCDRLDTDEKETVDYMRTNDKISRKELMELLNIKETKAKDIFNSLIKKRWILREGKGRATRYILVEK